LPLKALLEEKPFLAWNLTKAHRRLPFKCPHCEDDFIVVMGTIRRKHFRHRTYKDHGTEPESENHLEMKEYFLKESDKLGYDADVEVAFTFDDELSIADVVINAENPHTPLVKGIVVECQCSSIKLDELGQRNIDYMNNGLIPIWVLGGRYQDRRQARKKLTQVEEILLEKYGVLFYYDHGELVARSFPVWNEQRIETIDVKILLDSTLRKINSLDWMPLNTQIDTRMRISEGIGFFQIRDNQIYSMYEARNVMERYPDSDIIDITGMFSFKDGLEMFIEIENCPVFWGPSDYPEEGHTYKALLPDYVI
jgi:hypothetical protein